MTKLKAFALTAALVAGSAGIAAAQPKSESDGAELRAAKKAEMLAKYDTNKDGKLDAQEKTVMRDQLTLESFKKMDTNGDGVITLDEFKAGRAKMFEHRHARSGKHGFRNGL